MKKIYNLLFLLVLSISGLQLHAQVTTSSISGQISDSSGENLPGATVIALHVPTGTQYGTTTRPDGRFNLPNLKVGGPYSLVVSYIGYSEHRQDGLFLTLGQNFKYDLVMIEDITQLAEIIISGDNDVFGKDRTGAEMSFANEDIRKLPTITRSAQDIYRLTPSSDGNSFAGRNDQFNNFSLDGSIFSNPFGLDAATPGGQTDAQPISLDAIDQIQVAIAPYDVTQSGFTGASINAVTKSGTNDISGTVFGFYRNDGFTGSKIDGEDAIVADLTQLQTGFSLGGPIVKDKAFFFVNLEIERRDDLGSAFAPNRGTGAQNESRVLASDLDYVSNLFRTNLGYETGPYEDFTLSTDNQKGIVKFDFALNKNHSLTAIYNFLDATKEKPAHPTALGSRGPNATTLQYKNSGYAINNIIHSGLLEFKSIFGNKASNKLQLGYTLFDDSRNPFSSPFPTLNITQSGTPYIIAGHEPFSIHNRLEQRVIQFTDNFDLYLGSHTLTLGTSFEKFSFDNSFNLFTYNFFLIDNYDINFIKANEAAFLATVGGYQAGAISTFADNNANDDWALAETNLGQWAIYAQDTWEASDNLTLSFGLRLDVPLYFNTSDKIQENIDRKGGLLDPVNGIFDGNYAPSVIYYDDAGNPVQFDHTDLPIGNLLVSPRIGFNYDVNGSQTNQIRGGSGLFTGRLPFVWIGNQVANPDFFFYTMTDKDFKYPQVWRTNIGWDRKFGNGWGSTVDFMYTKDINGMMVKNYGLKPPTATVPGENRPAYNSLTDRAFDPFGGPTNAYVFTNTNKGRSVNLTLQLNRKWDNKIYASLSYNYLDAKSVSSIESEISGDAFALNPIGNYHSNNEVLAPSVYGNQHRIVGNANRSIEYGDGSWKTTFSIFFEYAQGGRFSYTYAGDINNDGSALNDLIYIPKDDQIDAMNFNTSGGVSEAAQRQALKAYIAQDDYLSENRGNFAERYGALSPWYSRWDFRILQDYYLSNGHEIEFSIDILNIGNFISSKWGLRQVPVNKQILSVDTSSGYPVYTFDPGTSETFVFNSDLISRWQLQFGLRYSF